MIEYLDEIFESAGLMLLGVEAHSHFFDTNEAAKTWLNQYL